ncbi:hypothetical protein Tco_0556314 [Tanacetum coccineum]
MVINSPCLTDKKELAILGKTATSKEFSNLLMAGSLPKTISSKNTATSKIVYSVKQIPAIVDGKAVVISELSVRNDLLFDDKDGITCLTNDDIFENLALMGYEQLSTKLTFQKANIEQILPSQSIYQRKHRKTPKNRRGKKVTELPQTSVPLDLGADKAVHKEGSDNVERAITIDASLGMDTGGSPRRQETMEGVHTQTRSERVLKQPNEPPFLEGHTSGSGEGRMAHTFELMDIVLDMEKEKDAQAVEILKLKKIVNKIERQRKSSISHPRKRIYKKIESFDDDLDEEDASKQGRKSDKTKLMFKDSDFDGLDDDMENVEGETVYVATSGVSTAGALVSTTRPTVSTSRPSTSAAGTSTVKIKRSDQGDLQLQADAELAQLLHQEELAQVERLQQEEREQFTIKERA